VSTTKVIILLGIKYFFQQNIILYMTENAALKLFLKHFWQKFLASLKPFSDIRVN